MVANARRRLLGGERQAFFHCWSRCVRRYFLCGHDRQTGKDYTHRRRWIIDREELPARLFAIQIEFRAELANHLHLILQTLPRVAKRWSPQEVVRRWLTATKMAKCLTDDVQLLLWTAEQLKSGQRHTIPADLMAVLDCFHVRHDAWLDTVEKFGEMFGQAVGRADTLTPVAERMGLQHMKGIAACRATFT